LEEKKKEMYDNIATEPYDVADFYKESGPIVRLCTDSAFENCTFTVIGVNALYMGFDSDNNTSDVIDNAHILFQLCESFFCIYFTIELSVRFMSFKVKRNCLRDAWFTFDSVLVTLMIAETWILPLALGGGSMPIDVQFLRLLRLLRLARMVRLLRGLPELLALVKAMGAAIRSVSTVFFLLILIIYVFAILHRMMLGGLPGPMADYFGSIPTAMTTLFYVGTLADGIWDIWKDVWQVGTDGNPAGYIFLFVFFSFVFLSMFTLMNMLIGVLCEVVTAVSEQSQEETKIDFVRERLLTVLNEIDEDANGMISRVEFNQLCADERSQQAFLDLDVDIENFESMTGFLFDADEPGEPDKELPFADMLKRVLMMRATQNARVFDVMEVSKHSTRQSQLLVDKSSAATKAAKELPMAPTRHPTQKFVGASDITARVQRFEESFENRIDGIETAVLSLVAQVGELTANVRSAGRRQE
jgi:voltage-gated sodium channel